MNVSEKTLLEIQISTNGPGRKLFAVVDLEDLSITDLTFHLISYGEVKREEVDRGTALWRYAENTVQGFYAG